MDEDKITVHFHERTLRSFAAYMSNNWPHVYRIHVPQTLLP